MNSEGIPEPIKRNEQPSDLMEDLVIATPQPERVESGELLGEEMLHQMEIADARLDIEGASRYGDSWDKVAEWTKAGWNWAKRPSETYTEAIGKAALFSAGTTVFLAPAFLYRNCKQVYDARHKEESGAQFAQA